MTSKLINFFYKWHRFEKAENSTEIIDFDLIQQGNDFPGQYNSREEALEDLLEIIGLREVLRWFFRLFRLIDSI